MASRIDTIRLGLSGILQNRKFNINNTQGCKSSEMVSVVISSVVYDVSNNRITFVLRVSKFILLGLPGLDDQGTILLGTSKATHPATRWTLFSSRLEMSGFDYFVLCLCHLTTPSVAGIVKRRCRGFYVRGALAEW